MGKKLKWAAGIAAAAAGAAAYFAVDQNRLQPEIFTLRCDVKKPTRILHLSDLHGKQFGPKNTRLLGEVYKLHPHLIVITGDWFADGPGGLGRELQLVKDLCRYAPVYYVPGNHEQRGGRSREMCVKLQQCGAIVLCNEMDTIEINGSTINILGLDDWQGSYRDYFKGKKLKIANREDLFAQFETRKGVRLVLTHYPENFAEKGVHSYRHFNFDLMFAGHAHGGQFRLPGTDIGALAPGQGLFPRYSSGMYGGGPCLLVSRGLGNSFFSLRVFNRPHLPLCILLPNK